MRSIKDFLPSGLYWRTFLIFIIPVFLLQIAVSVVFFERHWSKMTERLALAVSGEIAAVIDGITIYDDENLLSVMDKNLDLEVNYTPQGNDFPIRTGTADHKIIEDLNRALSKKITVPYAVSFYPDAKRVYVDIVVGQGLLSIIVPEGRLYSASSYIFILWMIGLSILLFSIALLFMRNQIRPIYRLGLIAERLGRGIPVGRFKPTGAREVRQAGEAFIQMQGRINDYVDQRTAMLAGVSHDLRTPLTRMKLQIELLGDTPDADALKGDIVDMEQMIEGYLSFAKGDGGEAMQRVDIDTFMQKILQDTRRLNVTLWADNVIDTDKTMWMKPKALERACMNFISNASRYGDTIEIKTCLTNTHYSISIADNGCGVAPENYGDILKPFYRAEGSRNQKTGGVGLGMTIANDIIMSHAGVLELQKSDKLGGLQVVITLPI